MNSERKITILTIALFVAGCGGAKYPLQRIGSGADEATLKALYAERELPLVIIGNGIFRPACSCLEGPCGRMHGSTVEERKIGATAESRNVSELAEAREHGQAGERRERGEAMESRNGGQASDQRTGGNASESRANGADRDARTTGNATEGRDHGGDLTALACKRAGAGKFKVISASAQALYVYDSRGLREVRGMVVDY